MKSTALETNTAREAILCAYTQDKHRVARVKLKFRWRAMPSRL